LSFAEAANTFGFELWTAMETTGNTVISPASVYAALSMTSAGATRETAAEMTRVLHQGDDHASHHRSAHAQGRRWTSPEGAPYVLTVANRLFADDSLSPSPAFLELTGERYGAPMKTLSIAAAPESSRGAINRWIAEVTREKIPELLPPGSLSSQTRMVLTNAIYFKGLWRHPFKTSRTSDSPFQVSADETVQVPMMAQTEDLRFARTDSVSIVELPYSDGPLSMVVVLPHEGADLAVVEQSLTNAVFLEWMETLRSSRVDLQLPRFKLDPRGSMTLVAPLKRLGMTRAFGSGAQFELIGPDLHISDVFHKAMIEVNEEGAEAAAATALVMRTKSMPRLAEFHADHPFLFFLRDHETSTVLFMGRIANPGEE